MYRTLLAAAVVLVMTACGNGNEQSKSGEETAAYQEQPSTPGRQAIPEKVELPTVTEGVAIKPFFDEAGTQSEKSVAVGESFKLYLVVETTVAYPFKGAQLIVKMPTGIVVESTKPFSDMALTMGTPERNFAIAFGCQETTRLMIATITCKTEEGFAGGEIEVVPGFDASGDFLGLASCEDYRVPAAGGKAVIKKM